MLLPPFGAKEKKNAQYLGFGGLDLRTKPAEGSLWEMENLSADAYPAVTPRKPRNKVLSASGISTLCPPEDTGEEITAFTGVRDGQFYYQGNPIAGEALSKGEKSIADFNGKICIFPDKVYYDYLPDPDTGEVSDSLMSMEKRVHLVGVTFYSAYDKLTGAYTAYISKDGARFDRFSPGDSIVISGSTKAQNNVQILSGRKDFAAEDAIVSAVVEKATDSKLELLLFTKSGGYASFENCTDSTVVVTIGINIPDMDHVCVHNNRLWGTAENGEYLYASRLGDCMNFHSFQGLSEDSWYGRVGTPGGFTGICSYRTAVVAFKRNCIHHIYGDAPQNFAIPKQTMGGCLDGRSIAELGGVLYYLSDRGFCAYSGGEPYGVSQSLGENHYQKAVAGTDGRRYYVAAYGDSTVCDVLVFDPELGTWHQEDHTAFLGFIFHGGVLYGATKDALWAFGKGEERCSWSMTTQKLTYRNIDHKGLSALWLRLEKEDDASVLIEISHDGESFSPCGKLTPGSGFGVRRVPVRFQKCDSFQIRVSGQGRVVIHDLEMETYQGGRNYGI